MIPGPDDGKVFVKRAKLEGIKDFLAVPVTHPFIMKSDKIIEQTIHFLRWIGVGNGARRLLPPNPVCGSPATGSPVSCFRIGIGAPSDGPRAS